MLEKILIILAIVPLFVINSFCDKIASKQEENKHNRLYNLIKFLAASLVLLPVTILDSANKFGLGAIICGVICGVMYAISKTVILKGYEKTSVAFMTLCHAAGMIIPCIIGHFFWSEKLTIFSLIGIILAIISIVLLSDSKGGKRPTKEGALIGLIVFLASGVVMILQKLMGLYFADQSVMAYNLYSFVAAFIILGFLKVRKTPKKASLKPIIICSVLSAVSLVLISVVMTKMASGIPSVIIFPLFNGLGIILVCIGSAFLFKEKITAKKAIGLILGIIGLFLVNL